MKIAHPRLALCCLLALAGVVLPAWAGRPVAVYDVTVQAAADAGAVAQDAMRQALVRATGSAQAAADPAFAPLIAHAGDYVRGTQPAGDGLTQVSLDGTAIERQINALGRSVWDPNRPFVIVVLSPAPTGAADDQARRALEQVAERRGLPVSLVPMAVTDSSGMPLAADALLTAARRLGGDAVLVGRSDATPPDGDWQWTLITGLATQSWNGPFDAGVGGAADALARVAGSSLPLQEEDATVRVSGIGTLADYAAVERMLGELPGVRRSGLAEADGSTATFHVLIRGGAQAIERALSSADHLTRTGPAGTGAVGAASAAGRASGAGGPLEYRYHP